jgi:hypothetical protein
MGLNGGFVLVNLLFGIFQVVDGDFPFSLIVAVAILGIMYWSFRVDGSTKRRLAERGMTNPYV